MNRLTSSGLVLGMLTLLCACDTVDRVRGTTTQEATAPSGGVTLNLESPGVVGADAEVAFRLSVWNRGDTAVSGLRAELVLPVWMQPLAPEPAGTSVTMVRSEDGTHLVYAVAEPPLQAGESRTVVQRVRTPGDAEMQSGAPSRAVRAWLVGADGHPLGAEVASDIVVEGMPAGERADTAALMGDARTRNAIERESIGPLRLGMTPEEVRQRYPQARDTAWTVEGTRERGMVVPLAGDTAGQVVLARLQNQRVDQIRVRDRQLRTAEGLGVGSRLEDLRSAYGQACASAERGEVVVWFAQKPGISFVLDARPPANPDTIRRDPAQLGGSATVRELFVRRGTDGC